MDSSSTFHTDVTADDPAWEYDFRDEIRITLDRAQNKDDLKTTLNKVFGRYPEATVSDKVGGFCNAASSGIPQEYNLHSRKRSTSEKATELRQFLTEQIGRPAYNKVTSITNTERAQLIVALRALEAGISRPADAVPTSLPKGAERFIPETAPERGQPTPHPDIDPDALIELTEGWQDRIQSWVSDTEEFVYAFDATPAIEEEPEDITLLRRHVEAKIRNGDAGENLSGIYRAGYHLNNDDSVYYVGKANDAIDRLERHLQGATHSGSNFPHLFRPTEGVIEITGVGPNEDADKAEEERAAAFTETGYSWAYFN